MLEFLKTLIIIGLLNQKTMDSLILRLRKGQVKNSKHNTLSSVILQCAVHTASKDDGPNILIPLDDLNQPSRGSYRKGL